MEQVWDPRGEAFTALARVVEGFGPQVLGRADMLEGLLQDDIPALPREAALLTAAARSGVADLLAGRVEQGIPPPAAVSMAAAEMTARTAVDASGAPWAAGAFARVLGYPVPAPTIPQDAPTPAPEAEALAPPTVISPASRAGQADQVPGVRSPDQDTVLPVGDQRPTVPVPAAAGRGLATAAAAAAAIAAPMQLLWGLDASAQGVLGNVLVFGGVTFWMSAVLLIAGLGGVAVFAARGQVGGAGFAALFGLAVPVVSTVVILTAIAATLTDLPGSLRTLLELISAFWLIAALAAAGFGLAGLIRQHQLVRYKPSLLTALMAAAGVGYSLAHILAQYKFPGELFLNVLGPGVHGWWIVWGIVFLVLASAPPVLAAFRLPDLRVQIALWSGWLLFGLAAQVFDSPNRGSTAASGLYLTWILWAVVLAGTAVMARRRRAGAVAGSTAHS